MKRLIYPSLCYLSILLVGCTVTKSDLLGGDTVITDYIIVNYERMTDFSLSSAIYFGNQESIKVMGESEHYYMPESLRDGDKYDDYHYNSVQIPGGYSAYVNEFQKIEVVSDVEFNGVPAGESIADKVMIFALTPYFWLKSGSTVTYDWSTSNVEHSFFSYLTRFYTLPQMYLVNKKLSFLTEDDLQLLCPDNIYFRFIEKPEIKTHNITISFIEKDKSLESSVEVIFE